MMAMLALLAAAAEPAASDFAMPVANLTISDVAYACSESGYPTLGIDYRNGRGIVDYNEVATPILFNTIDSVKFVKVSQSGEWYRLIIEVEGPAMQGGQPLGYTARLHIVLSQFRDNYFEAEWTVDAGNYHKSATGCRPIPSRPRMIEHTQ